MLTKDQLTTMAKTCGFSRVGVVKARIFDELLPELFERIHRKQVTSFEAKDPYQRINPFLLMPEAKTIIVTATSYFTHHDPSAQRRPHFSGELARFSWGLDYHRIIHQQLGRLADLLQQQQPGLKFFRTVDTGPLVERYLAVQSGLGLYGRNNCLIVPGAGSFVVLGLLLTNEEVEGSSSSPIPLPSCRGCGRCQQACPAKALESPYRVDITRCISHLLQCKEPVPEPQRLIIDRKLYGCDICQEVCPYNQEADPPPEPAMTRYADDPWIDLEELLFMSNRQFNRRFRSRAFGWRGQRVLQRNALMILGNETDVNAMKILKHFNHHERLELREIAEWAIQRLQDSK